MIKVEWYEQEFVDSFDLVVDVCCRWKEGEATAHSQIFSMKFHSHPTNKTTDNKTAGPYKTTVQSGSLYPVAP